MESQGKRPNGQCSSGACKGLCSAAAWDSFSAGADDPRSSLQPHVPKYGVLGVCTRMDAALASRARRVYFS